MVPMADPTAAIPITNARYFEKNILRTTTAPMYDIPNPRPENRTVILLMWFQCLESLVLITLLFILYVYIRWNSKAGTYICFVVKINIQLQIGIKDNHMAMRLGSDFRCLVFTMLYISSYYLLLLLYECNS